MNSTLAQNWWLLALRGALSIAFGIVVFLWPELAWLLVVATFAAFALLDGIFAILMAITGQTHGRVWWSLILEGIFGISAAVLTFLWSAITELVLLFLIAYWAIATGIFEIVTAVRLRKEIEGEWALGLGGALSVLFGVALILMPTAGAIAIAWLIAANSFVFGVLMLILAFRLRAGRYLPATRTRQPMM